MFERVTLLLTVVAIPRKYATNTRTCASCTATIAKVFCFKCIGPHCKHDFVPVSDKACEVRKEIFEYLGEFEKLAKPMSVQESQVRSVLSHHQALYPGLTLDTLVDFLCEKFSASLRNDGQNLVNIVEKKSVACSETEANQNVFVVSQKSGDQIASLRKMLSMSDGVCVSTFLESTSQLEPSIEEQKKELNVFTVRSWTNSLDNIIKGSVASAVAAWEFPNVLRQNIWCLDVVTAVAYHWKEALCIDIYTGSMRYLYGVPCICLSKLNINFCNSSFNAVASALSLQFHCITGTYGKWKVKKYSIPFTGGAPPVFSRRFRRKSRLLQWLVFFFVSSTRTSTFCALIQLMHIFQLLPYVLSTSFSTHPKRQT